MNGVQLPVLLLRLRLGLARIGPAAAVAALLCVLGVAAWAWLLPQRAAHQRMMAQPLQTAPAAASGALAVAPPPPTADQNLAAFYGVLGERRYAEQQVKLLFDLAAKGGLNLAQGEYKFGYDKASRVSTYQIMLPVKGQYQAIWRFALEALRALPFAALDDVSFRRDSIADATVEARVRLTLYLKDAGVKDDALNSADVAVQP